MSHGKNIRFYARAHDVRATHDTIRRYPHRHQQAYSPGALGLILCRNLLITYAVFPKSLLYKVLTLKLINSICHHAHIQIKANLCDMT